MIVPPSPGRETGKAPVGGPTGASLARVSDGARTRDTQDHNLVLYQLSYTHHVSRTARWAAGRPGNRANDTGGPQASDAARPGVPASSAANRAAKESATRAAAACAWDVEGPGASTKSVCR